MLVGGAKKLVKWNIILPNRPTTNDTIGDNNVER